LVTHNSIFADLLISDFTLRVCLFWNPKPNCQRSTALAFGTLRSPAPNNQPSNIDCS